VKSNIDASSHALSHLYLTKKATLDQDGFFLTA